MTNEYLTHSYENENKPPPTLHTAIIGGGSVSFGVINVGRDEVSQYTHLGQRKTTRAAADPLSMEKDKGDGSKPQKPLKKNNY